ncbi:MAG: TonB family protein [Planctomycetes bacterium]|nr:TonB family protein [Planctomycetota bacterium]
MSLAAAGWLLVRATVLLSIALGALALSRGRSAALRELVGRWFLVALCLLPLLAASGLSIGILPSFGSATDVGSADRVLLQARDLVAAGSEFEAMGTSDPASALIDLAYFAMLVWIAGAGILLARAAIGHVLAVHRLFGPTARDLPVDLLARLGVDRRTVRLSPATDQPVAAGLLRARVAVPPAFLQWSFVRQRAVLAHELAHVERRDGLAVLLAQAVRALWWPHPLAWVLARRLALLREQACDDRALDDGFTAATYAAALVAVARAVRSNNSDRPPVLAMTTISQLEARVRALLRIDGARGRPHLFDRFVTGVLVLVLGLLCATGNAVAQGEPPPPREAAVPTEIRLVVTQQGDVLHADREIGVDGVRAAVERLLADGPRSVVVVCSREVSAGLLVRVIDEAKLAGAKEVAIATAPANRPLAIRQVSPAIPLELRQHLPATVHLVFTVDTAGSVIEPTVQDSTDPRFDELALRAVEQWRFEPARRDGKPVATRLRVPLRFPDPAAPPAPASEQLDLDALEASLEARRSDLPNELDGPLRERIEELLARLRERGGEAADLDRAVHLLEGWVERQRSAERRRDSAAKPGVIRCHVQDTDFDAPVSDARVTLRETGTQATGGTDGNYVFARVPAGSYTVVVAREGYEPKVHAGVVVTAGRLTDVAVGMTARVPEPPVVRPPVIR